jgi:hypothetical protein
MPATYKKIASVTVGSGGTNTIDFTSIPSTYTDLVVLASFRSTRSNDEDGGFMTINSSTTGYSWRLLQGNGTAASSSSGTDRFIGQLTANTTTASTFTNLFIYIPNYAGSTNKSYSVDNVTEANATKSYAQLIANLWSNTAAITSLSFQSDSLGIGSKLAEFSTATLYGILKK